VALGSKRRGSACFPPSHLTTQTVTARDIINGLVLLFGFFPLSRLSPADHAKVVEAVPVHGPFSIALRDRAGARRDASAARIEPDGYAHSTRGLGTGGV
jgi:hypothetical protein